MNRVKVNFFKTRNGKTCYLSKMPALIFVSVSILCLFSRIVPISSDQNHELAERFLSIYGYISPVVTIAGGFSEHVHPRNISEAVREFQAFYGLEATGNLDNDTMRLMSMPRCGIADKMGASGFSRNKRYVLGDVWDKLHLTYKISKYNSRRSLTRKQVDLTVEYAFAHWSRVTRLTFQRVDSKQSADIDIRFESYGHGDGDPFDGSHVGYNILAHACYPPYGWVHFDDSELWTMNTSDGTNFLQVAVHEFGHALGLHHSGDKGSVMYPSYLGYSPAFKLHPGDVKDIQALYGPPMTNNPAPTDDPFPPNLCSNGSIDAIMEDGGYNYVFKGNQYWKLTGNGIANGYPKVISSVLVDLPNDIDAAFTISNGTTYYFKGAQFWKYSGITMLGNHPIRSTFPGIPNDIQGATLALFRKQKHLFFFKGDKYWRYDFDRNPPVNGYMYPRQISRWFPGIPNDIDDVHFQNGYWYFFKSGKYYRFNGITSQVDNASPPYPRNVGSYWFGC